MHLRPAHHASAILLVLLLQGHPERQVAEWIKARQESTLCRSINRLRSDLCIMQAARARSRADTGAFSTPDYSLAQLDRPIYFWVGRGSVLSQLCVHLCLNQLCLRRRCRCLHKICSYRVLVVRLLVVCQDGWHGCHHPTVLPDTRVGLPELGVDSCTRDAREDVRYRANTIRHCIV